jgi:hypothetical protein
LVSESALKGLVVTKDLIPLGEVFDIEDASVETKLSESAFGYKKMQMPSLLAFKATMNYTKDQEKIINGLTGRKFTLFMGDCTGNLFCCTDAVGDYKGYDIKPLIIDTRMPIGENASAVTILFQVSDSQEYTQKGIEAKVAFPFSAIEPITKVKLTSSAIATGDGTFTVTFESNSNLIGGSFVSGAVTGLVLANFEVKSSTGSARTFTVADGTVDGTYTVTSTESVDLSDKARVIPTVDAPYESDIITLV